MVRAILDGRKTQTRRAVKPQPLAKIAYCFACSAGSDIGKWTYPGDIVCELWGDESYRLPSNIPHNEKNRKWSPPYHTDDILYVRETFCKEEDKYYYRADFDSDYLDPCETLSGGYPSSCRYRNCDSCSIPVQRIIWKPSIHMPKEAARIFTNVSVAELQDITVSEAIKEGTHDVWFDFAHKMKLKDTLDKVDLPSNNFIKTWNSTIKKNVA